MDIIQYPDWLAFAFAGWVVISVLAAPLVGRFVAGSLHERAEQLSRSAAQTKPQQRPRGAIGHVPAPSSGQL